MIITRCFEKRIPAHLKSQIRHAHNGDRLHGRKCIITGASGSIGRAIAEQLADKGVICTLVGRNEELLQTARKSLKASWGGPPSTNRTKHRIFVGNVADRAFWEEIALASVGASRRIPLRDATDEV